MGIVHHSNYIRFLEEARCQMLDKAKMPYSSFEENGNRPIAIEPYGAVTTLGKAFRISKDKADFYTLFDKYSLGDDFDSPEDAHYVMAMLVRGGVFGQSSKE